MDENEKRPFQPSGQGGANTNSRVMPFNTTTANSDLGYSNSSKPDEVLENVIENVIRFLTSMEDRNAASLVCKSWYRAEGLTRLHVNIINCYAVSPQRVINRFGRATSVAIKGDRYCSSSFAECGYHFSPWVNSMTEAYRGLEKVYLKMMLVTDDDLGVLARSAPNLKELILVRCDGFGARGLGIVASECRQIRVFEQIDLEVDLDRTAFQKALSDLGTGKFGPEVEEQDYFSFATAFAACKSLECLSGFMGGVTYYIWAIVPVYANHKSLDVTYTTINAEGSKSVIFYCHKLQALKVSNSVGEKGLKAVAASCKDLRELRLVEESAGLVSEVGMLAIFEGCRKMQYFQYDCHKITNATLVAMSKNCCDLPVLRNRIRG